MTPEERSSSANAIWLCNSCGRLIDNDATTYTVAQLAVWKLDAIERAREALASGGRNTTEKLFAAQLEVQKKSLAQQQEHHQVEVRERQREKFSDVYGRFLEEAKAYAGTIDAYWTWMHKTGFTPDRPAREEKQKAIKDAYDAMQRASQPILLSDDDKARGALRWELTRRRGFEPIIDTRENQRAWSEVTHYHYLRLLDGIGRLQTNVRAALGMDVREESDQEKEFHERTFADARAKAEAVEQSITSQYQKMAQDAAARKASGAAAASPQEGSPVRNRVWNVLHVGIFEFDHEDMRDPRNGNITRLYLREVWRESLVRPVDELPADATRAWAMFRTVFMTCDEQTFYRIVERTGRDKAMRDKLQAALEQSGASCRFVDGALVALTRSPSSQPSEVGSL